MINFFGRLVLLDLLILFAGYQIWYRQKQCETKQFHSATELFHLAYQRWKFLRSQSDTLSKLIIFDVFWKWHLFCICKWVYTKPIITFSLWYLWAYLIQNFLCIWFFSFKKLKKIDNVPQIFVTEEKNWQLSVGITICLFFFLVNHSAIN